MKSYQAKVTMPIIASASLKLIIVVHMVLTSIELCALFILKVLHLIAA